MFFVPIDRQNICSSTVSTTIPLANVVHIQEDSSNDELRFIVAGLSNKSSKHSSSIKMMRIHVRFEHRNDYFLWLHQLTNAIQQAKDQSWTNKNELVI